MPSSAQHHHDYEVSHLRYGIPDAFLAAPPRQLAMPPLPPAAPDAQSRLLQRRPTTRQHCVETTRSVRVAAARGGRGGARDLLLLDLAGGDGGEPPGEEDGEEIRDCVIVGAGIAGLAAGADLQQAGMDLVVLEAADRFGGRIFTHEESRSHHHPPPHSSCEEGVTTTTTTSGGIPSRPLELGAQWLHGTVGNPLFDFCVEEGIFDSQEGRIELAMAKRAYAARDVQARRPDGTQVSRREFVRHSEAWSQAVLEAETLYAASLAAEAETAAEGHNAEDQQQQQQRQNLDPKRLEAAATATVPNSPRQDPQVNGIGHDVNNGGSTPSAAISADSRREDRVGAFLHLRVREILRAGGGSSGGCGIDEDILGYLVRKQHAVEGCDDLDVVSVAGYGMYEELEGGDVRVPGGFSRVVEALAAKISPERIRLQSPVTRVQWDSQGQEEERRDSPFAESHPCVVEYTTRRHSSGGIDVGGEQGHSDRVSTMRIRCRRVLVTVGLGVLKDGTALTFSPPLPQAKLAAIRRLGFGTADKFFVRCTRKGSAGSGRAGPDASLNVGVLRPIEQQQQQQQQGRRRWRDRGNSGHQSSWVDDVFSFHSEGRYVYSWLTGASARAAERTQDAEHVTDALLSLLRTTTRDPSWQAAPEQDQEQDQALDGVGRGTTAATAGALVRSDWYSNPLFRGSYSYLGTGSSPADMEELGRPLSAPGGVGAEGTGSGPTGDGRRLGEEDREEPVGEGDGGGGSLSRARVLFAGEAMHARFFSTAHGGFDTGRRAAREVLASCGFKDCSDPLHKPEAVECDV